MSALFVRRRGRIALWCQPGAHGLIGAWWLGAETGRRRWLYRGRHRQGRP